VPGLGKTKPIMVSSSELEHVLTSRPRCQIDGRHILSPWSRWPVSYAYSLSSLCLRYVKVPAADLLLACPRRLRAPRIYTAKKLLELSSYWLTNPEHPNPCCRFPLSVLNIYLVLAGSCVIFSTEAVIVALNRNRLLLECCEPPCHR
jgi:hypothetical protein